MLTLALFYPISSHAEEVVDQIVAVVDQDIITLRQLQKKAAELNLGSTSEPSEWKQTLREILDLELQERLIDIEVKKSRARLGVTDADVDRAIESILQDRNASRDQLQSALYREGMTWSEYRKNIRKQLERSELIDMKVRGRIRFSEDEVRQRCQQSRRTDEVAKVCANQILISRKDAPDDQAILKKREKAERIRKELSDGADFQAYVKAFSDDQYSETGDIGCFGRGEMVDAFEQAAFETPTDQISTVIATELGFHIIKVRERQFSQEVCVESTQLRQYQQVLYQERFQREITRWVDELRKQTYVEILTQL